MKKKFYVAIIAAVFILGGFFYFRHQVYYSRGSFRGSKVIKIEKGERNKMIAAKLEKEGLISGKIYFYYYLWSRKLASKILPDEYKLSGNLTIPEVSLIITEERNKTVKITFPEGWTSKQMADRIADYGFKKDDFLYLTDNYQTISSFDFFEYKFLEDDKTKNLEGYLFPDTYFFSRDASEKDIVIKMLNNFDKKLAPEIRDEIKNQNKSTHEIVTIASIIEDEVRSDEDRKIVSGIFWKRLKEGRPLQSCATLAYVTGNNKKQYSEADTKINSPFNTYLMKGLPPAPISNPGLSAIKAAVYPEKTDYNYFLSDPETGQTLFAKDYEEHIANKAKCGL